MAVATKKKKVIRAPKAGKQVISWAGWEEMDGKTFHNHRRYAFDHYYQEHKTADLLPNVYHWMKENGYTKEQIESAKARGSNGMTMAAIVARCLKDGMPDYNPKHNEYWQELPGTMGDVKPVTENLRNYVDEAVRLGKPVMEEKIEVAEQKEAGPTITIQDRLREAAFKMTDEIETAIDSFITDPEAFNPKEFKVLNLLKGKEAKAAHARVIKSFYQPALDELEELASPNADEQLREGYSNYSKKQIRNMIAFYQEVIGACDMLAQEQKVTRKPRKAKAVNKEKLVAKIKYKKTDEALKLVSINPADIIGASELWIYNVKSRKIGKYVAANVDPTGQGRAGSGLTIKGTTIQGYKEDESVMKTVRKPEEKLAEFKSAGKVQLRKFMDSINAVEARMNGRINADTILLKVVS